MRLRIVLALLLLSASATSVVPVASAASMCTFLEYPCPGTVCVSSSGRTATRSDCNILYVLKIFEDEPMLA